MSNVSLRVPRQRPVREAIHGVFLYHAIRAGLDMAIVNAGALPQYDDIDPDLLERVEDVVLEPAARRDRPAAGDRAAIRGRRGQQRAVDDLGWRECRSTSG